MNSIYFRLITNLFCCLSLPKNLHCCFLKWFCLFLHFTQFLNNSLIRNLMYNHLFIVEFFYLCFFSLVFLYFFLVYRLAYSFMDLMIFLNKRLMHLFNCPFVKAIINIIIIYGIVGFKEFSLYQGLKDQNWSIFTQFIKELQTLFLTQFLYFRLFNQAFHPYSILKVSFRNLYMQNKYLKGKTYFQKMNNQAILRNLNEIQNINILIFQILFFRFLRFIISLITTFRKFFQFLKASIIHHFIYY
ncbi:hypothetical protein IMG5_159330 [Ichthyophthirius multifiliis]|uniref:Transmembrane protein n=1 Tax=Ichthyophthirius multifiliis TaxID=5932 RepID=G0QZR9_ICHMU|nr:hypothetical protein IMG5_159330 [Ichthyophthirius multifiliis]EGR29286.1 hypothetical protein IMG5_159330 [Ichthyophthirius multifiliis]|eukprot:XP_004030522.1 hypothetical protein IMG5_159330 [Ichthyophthirius multifiliis]